MIKNFRFYIHADNCIKKQQIIQFKFNETNSCFISSISHPILIISVRKPSSQHDQKVKDRFQERFFVWFLILPLSSKAPFSKTAIFISFSNFLHTLNFYDIHTKYSNLFQLCNVHYQQNVNIVALYYY